MQPPTQHQSDQRRWLQPRGVSNLQDDALAHPRDKHELRLFPLYTGELQKHSEFI